MDFCKRLLLLPCWLTTGGFLNGLAGSCSFFCGGAFFVAEEAVAGNEDDG
jgi:hypothetical protein